MWFWIIWLQFFNENADGAVLSIDHLRLAQCAATCLAEYGVVNYQQFQSGRIQKESYCADQCEGCSAACGAYSPYDASACFNLCTSIENQAPCVFGCNRMLQLHSISSLINGTTVTANVSSSNLRVLCLNRNAKTGLTWIRLKADLTELLGNAQSRPSIIYLVEASFVTDGNFDRISSWKLLSMKTNHLMTEKLPKCTHFKLRVFAVNATGLLKGNPMQTGWIRSLNEDTKLRPPTSLSIAYQTRKTADELSVLVTWQPHPLYRSCFYHLAWQSGETARYSTFGIEDDFEYLITSLPYDTDYTMTIAAASSKNLFHEESQFVTISFHTLTCLEATGYNLMVCAPGPLAAVPTIDITESEALINWKPPQRISDNNNSLIVYNVQWQSLIHMGRCSGYIEESLNITENTYSIKLDDLEDGCFYAVGISAMSAGGIGRRSWTQFEYIAKNNGTAIAREIIVVTQSNTLAYILIGIGTLISCGITTAIIAVYRKKKNKKLDKNRSRQNSTLQSLMKVAQLSHSSSCLNITSILPSPIENRDFKDKITFVEQLGEGTFGRVYKAECFMSGMPAVVAVKTLKEVTNTNLRLRMRQEIELMKRLCNPQQNVVRFYGIASDVGGFVMEYCPNGNLKDFFKTITFQLMNVDRQGSLIDRPILLSYAHQICTGIQFLHDLSLVHRDLAARNILVTGGGKIVKISDFGLCRVTVVGEYKIASNAAVLPIKWMAPESIHYHIFSFKSDVWSYGVLLWEIMTKGDDPYSDITTNQFPAILENGYRLPRPRDCSDAMYSPVSSDYCPVLTISLPEEYSNDDVLQRRMSQ